MSILSGRLPFLLSEPLSLLISLVKDIVIAAWSRDE
jgi:hypothetical protein